MLRRSNNLFMRLLLVVFSVVAFVLPTLACDTPVYRYAMYKWTPAPYAIFHLHSGEPSDSFQSLQATIEKLGDFDAPIDTNLVVVDIDTSDKNLLLPRAVQEAWDARPEGAADVVSYLVSPKGGIVAEGDFTDPAYFAGLLDSPARQEIMDQLGQGKTGVLVFLTSSDEAETLGAELLVKEFIAQMAEGRIPAIAVDSAAADATTETSPKADPADAIVPDAAKDVGFVRVDRNNPEEAWLVRMLLAVEPGLDAFEKPMLFPVFGRGRALEPLIGAGISQQNLHISIDFVSGACSCTVADENPGVDLLTQADWDGISSLMAEIYGHEEGNEEQLSAAHLFPDILSPVQSSVEEPDSDSSSTEDESPTEEGTTSIEEGDEQVASPTSSAVTSKSEAAAFSNQLLWSVGIGVTVGMAFLFAATFFFFRPRVS